MYNYFKKVVRTQTERNCGLSKPKEGKCKFGQSNCFRQQTTEPRCATDS